MSSIHGLLTFSVSLSLIISFISLFFPTIFSNERPFDPRMKHFTDRLLNMPGLGTRCMQGELSE